PRSVPRDGSGDRLVATAAKHMGSPAAVIAGPHRRSNSHRGHRERRERRQERGGPPRGPRAGGRGTLPFPASFIPPRPPLFSVFSVASVAAALSPPGAHLLAVSSGLSWRRLATAWSWNSTVVRSPAFTTTSRVSVSVLPSRSYSTVSV